MWALRTPDAIETALIPYHKSLSVNNPILEIAEIQCTQEAYFDLFQTRLDHERNSVELDIKLASIHRREISLMLI